VAKARDQTRVNITICCIRGYVQYFLYLTAEIKCGNQDLEFADWQNMHSMCIGLRAVVTLEDVPGNGDCREFLGTTSQVLRMVWLWESIGNGNRPRHNEAYNDLACPRK
jgi:hypothetical protein